MSRRYFEEEMRYLREAGRAFAQAHPEQARLLNVDSVSDRDPYVERLFEGFAFLTGRIHERLDSELPEYTESLLSLLHPHFLKPFPSLTVVAFEPKPGLIQEPRTFERGTEVRSRPVGRENTVCRFQTTAPACVHPLTLDEARLRWSPEGTSRVRLRFSLLQGGDAGSLADAPPLRLYFHAGAGRASAMYHHFTRHVRAVTFRDADGPLDDQEGAVTLDGQNAVTPVGLERESTLLPYEAGTFQAFRLLHEYMCFRRRFWFVDVHGLDRFVPSGNAFDVTVHFDCAYPEDKSFRAENLRLGCAPAVNLFEADAEPIRLEGTASEYRVMPDAQRRRSVQTYDVQSVVGIEDETGRRHEYTPFFSFAHHQPPSPGSAGRPGATRDGAGRFYTTARRPGPDGPPEVFLSLGARGDTEPGGTRTETLLPELRCTNGTLPREELQEGMLNSFAPGQQADVAVPRNLTRPTLALQPPGRGDFLWEFVSHLSFNYATVASREALRGLLSLYDWTRDDANAQRLDGIKDVRWEQKETLREGAVLRGTEVTVELKEGHFADEGDLCLFGAVLSQFLSLYATLNSFVHLTVVVTPSGNTYRWTPRRGTQPLL